MVDLRTSQAPGKEIAPAPGTSSVKDDETIAIHGVTFDQYETVRAALDHVAGLRMTYRAGMLEIMSPGRSHELVKKLVARLIEVYALEMGIDLTGYGGMTFRDKAKELGLEPDECYTLGEMKEVPDFALEVVVTSWSHRKLDIYAGLGVPEVWVWQEGKFSIHRLGPKGYERAERSAVLPGLDFAELASLVASDKAQTEVVRGFRDSIRGSRP